MTRNYIHDKAIKANGRTKCDCWFIKNKCLNEKVCDLCSSQYIKGFKKGYNTHKKELLKL